MVKLLAQGHSAGGSEDKIVPSLIPSLVFMYYIVLSPLITKVILY